jgi:hypothetical protein
MFILARQGESYARLRFNAGPGADLEIPVDLDFSRPFTGCDLAAWEAEYLACVQPQLMARKASRGIQFQPFERVDQDPWDDWDADPSAQQSLQDFFYE